MELTSLNIAIAFWGSTWLMAQLMVFIPSMTLLGMLDKDHLSYRYWFFTWLIFGVGSFIFAPVFVLVILSDKYKEVFINSYVKSLMEKV